MRRPTIRIGTALLTPEMQARLVAGRSKEEVALGLLTLRAAGAMTASAPPTEWVDRMTALPFNFGALALALAEAERAEAAERAALKEQRRRSTLSRLARRALVAAAEARELLPPPPPPRARVYAMFPDDLRR
jgi:hypothetical protein